MSTGKGRRVKGWAAFALVAITVLASQLRAQTWRTFDVARSARDTQPVSVHVAYGAGRIRIQPTASRTLYDAHFRYDAERSEPTYSFDAASRRLDVGVRQTSVARSMKGGEGSELKLLLGAGSPMRLELDVGAAEGDIDLSGLRVEELLLQTGATDTRVRFDSPNPMHMRMLRMQVGAASVDVLGLGNANTDHVELNLGVGKAVLDFSGEWHGDADVSVASALGQVTLRVPGDVGIRVESSRFLHSVNATGMVKRDGYSVSDNWETARFKLRLKSSGALGSLDIERIAR
ncbi:MAG TPA: toast rack family protein [Gemmatimonadaceae bacterium]|nr:toast rack family protein [Gemmatimonadaceae bacterium]